MSNPLHWIAGVDTVKNACVCAGLPAGHWAAVPTWLLHASHDVHGDSVAQHFVSSNNLLQLNPVLVSSLQSANHTSFW